MTLPGGACVPAAAVSWVGVLPTHRRRGILTKMIGALHDDARVAERTGGDPHRVGERDLRPLRIRHRDVAAWACRSTVCTRAFREPTGRPRTRQADRARRRREDPAAAVRRDPQAASRCGQPSLLLVARGVLGVRHPGEGAVRRGARGRERHRRRLRRVRGEGGMDAGHSERRVFALRHPSRERRDAQCAVAVPARHRPRRRRHRDKRRGRRTDPAPARRSPARAYRLRERRPVAVAIRPPARCSAPERTRRSTGTSCSRSKTPTVGPCATRWKGTTRTRSARRRPTPPTSR